MRTPKEIAESWIDCTCDVAYTSRGLVAPDCPLHSFAVEEAILDAQNESWNESCKNIKILAGTGLYSLNQLIDEISKMTK